MYIRKIVSVMLGTVLLISGWSNHPATVIDFLRDTGIRSKTQSMAQTLNSQQMSEETSKSMPGNPSVSLPDKVSDAIPDSATVISANLAVTNNGTVRNLATGAIVTDPVLVGSKNHQADPLAKTNGQRFVPVPVATVKESVRQIGKNEISPSAGNIPDTSEKSSHRYESESHTSSTHQILAGQNYANVSNVDFPGNTYGAYWGSYNGQKAFFETNGSLFVQQARAVVDVSEWQQNINWQAAKDAGVQGAIIRISYGWDNSIDSSAQYNINECKRLGIPFGLYVYSYAANGNDGRSEAVDTLAKLHQAGVSPNDLSYPIFYDLEKWVDGNRTPTTDPHVYDDIVNSWYTQMNSGGFSNLKVYSYQNYLNGPLNTDNIHSKVGWVASYGGHTGFSYQNNFRGWQYSDQGNLAGISGTVDLNAFGNKNYVDEDPSGKDPSAISAQLSDITEGDYYIISSYSQKVIDIAWADKSNGVKAEIWQYNGGANQIFHIKPLSDHKYTIIASHSQKALDVFAGQSSNGAAIIQYTQTGSANQQWQIYRTSQGTVVFKSMTDSSKKITSGFLRSFEVVGA